MAMPEGASRTATSAQSVLLLAAGGGGAPVAATHERDEASTATATTGTTSVDLLSFGTPLWISPSGRQQQQQPPHQQQQQEASQQEANNGPGATSVDLLSLGTPMLTVSSRLQQQQQQQQQHQQQQQQAAETLGGGSAGPPWQPRGAGGSSAPPPLPPRTVAPRVVTPTGPGRAAEENPFALFVGVDSSSPQAPGGGALSRGATSAPGRGGTRGVSPGGARSSPTTEGAAPSRPLLAREADLPPRTPPPPPVTTAVAAATTSRAAAAHAAPAAPAASLAEASEEAAAAFGGMTAMSAQPPQRHSLGPLDEEARPSPGDDGQPHSASTLASVPEADTEAVVGAAAETRTSAPQPQTTTNAPAAGDTLTEEEAQAIIDAAEMAAAEAVVAAAEAQEARDAAAAEAAAAATTPPPTAAGGSTEERPAVQRQDSAVARALREIAEAEAAEEASSSPRRAPEALATAPGSPGDTGSTVRTGTMTPFSMARSRRRARRRAVSEQQEIAAAVAAVAEMEERERSSNGQGAGTGGRRGNVPIVRGEPRVNGGAAPGYLRCALCTSSVAATNAPSAAASAAAPGDGDSKRHCRNCWRAVCDECVGAYWARSMVPPRYRVDSNAHRMRVCKVCNTAMEDFRKALLLGQEEKAMSAYSTGVVNLDLPYTIYHGELPVHCAAAGGNVKLLSWLVDELGCQLFADPQKKVPNRDLRRLTILGAAAVNGQVQAMRYLVNEKGCSVSEIKHIPTLKAALDACLHGSANTRDAERSRYRADSSSSSSSSSDDGADNGGISAHALGDEQENDCCIVCFDSEVDCTLVPCGHHCCCVTCASKFSLCPVCRTAVTHKIKAIRV